MSQPIILHADEVLAVELVAAIHSGDTLTVGRILDDYDGFVKARIQDSQGTQRSLLHIVADWPGYFANGPVIVDALIAAGADPNARVIGGSFQETPLHWAASSDDLEVADALIAGGADIVSSGGSIAGGSVLDNAVGYGCWHVARRLVERGAPVDQLWHAAALGMLTRIDEICTATPRTTEELNDAFWQACHGGQRRAAERLLAEGADPTWTPGYAGDPPRVMATAADTRREALAAWLDDLSERGDR